MPTGLIARRLASRYVYARRLGSVCIYVVYVGIIIYEVYMAKSGMCSFDNDSR